jgi:hypothetical protein
MFGTLASIALMVGGVSATMVLNEDDRLAAEEIRAPIVEIRTADTLDRPTVEKSILL